MLLRYNAQQWPLDKTSRAIESTAKRCRPLGNSANIPVSYTHLVHELRFVRRYLERGPQLTLRQVDPLIRELVQYRDLINLRTQEPKE